MDDPDHIRAWQRLDALTTTSGRLLAEDIEALARLGVRHVINLAMPDHPEVLADEAALLAARGIAYKHIPVPFDAPDEAHLEAFREAMVASAGTPVHVHCIANWRVSAFFYRLNRQRMPEKKARKLMHQQWDPTEHPHPDAPAWAEFIAVKP